MMRWLWLALLLLAAPAQAQYVNGGGAGGSGGSIIIPNAASPGTTLNELAIVTGAPATATVALTTSTSGVIGVAQNGAGTSGKSRRTVAKTDCA